jgi:hypothetical protein
MHCKCARMCRLLIYVCVCVKLIHALCTCFYIITSTHNCGCTPAREGSAAPTTQRATSLPCTTPSPREAPNQQQAGLSSCAFLPRGLPGAPRRSLCVKFKLRVSCSFECVLAGFLGRSVCLSWTLVRLSACMNVLWD